MSFEAYMLAIVAVLLTGISKSGFAGGLGVLGVPLVALTMPPQDAATLLLPVLLLIDVVSVWRYRAAWKARTIMMLLPGAVLGIGLGMLTFAELDPDILRVAIGLLALAFVGRMFWRSPPKTNPDGRAGYFTILIASAVSGFAGFVAHAGGPPIKGTILRMGLEKSAFVGTNAIFFFTLNLSKGFGYAALSLYSVPWVLFALSLTPFALLGTMLGFALHDRISQVAFVRLTYVLLTLAGLNLVVFGGLSLFGQGA